MDKPPLLIDRTFHRGIKVEPRAMTDADGKEFWEFEISNRTVDSHRTIFDMAGGDISEFNEEPIVTYGHPPFDSTDPDDIIGSGLAYYEDDKLISRFYPEEGEDNTKAKKVVTKLRQKLVRSASIVAEIINWEYGKKDRNEDPNKVYFREWKLLMWGIVMKGSNPKAKMRSMQKEDEFIAALQSSTPTTETTTTESTEDLELESLLMEQRLRLMRLRHDSSTAAQY